MDNSDILLYGMNDAALLENIGRFIRHHRLEQNKTQQQTADEAGINRSTLIELESGKGTNLLTLIRLLRVLKLLHVLEVFAQKDEISPLLLAEIQMKEKKRASSVPKKSTHKKSDW